MAVDAADAVVATAARSELIASVDEVAELQLIVAECELGLAAVDDDSDSPPTDLPSCATELDADAD